VLTVLAGVHGCEYASMAAVRRWVRDVARDRLRGRVRAVPVLSITAFAARTPFVVPEDGKNLNRCFPGRADGTLADRLAYDTFRLLIEGSDAVIDAHCGDLVEALYPCTFYDIAPGDRVGAGQPLGAITSLDGAETLETITAPSAGVIMFLTSSPAVASEGLLLRLGVAGS
jgi:uncharacterized protein